MATLTFSYDTGNVSLSRIVDGMAAEYGYQPTIVDPETGQTVPNPQSKAEFGRAKIREIIVQAVRNTESKQARDALLATLEAAEPINLT